MYRKFPSGFLLLLPCSTAMHTLYLQVKSCLVHLHVFKWSTNNSQAEQAAPSYSWSTSLCSPLQQISSVTTLHKKLCLPLVQNTQETKRALFNWQKQDKTCRFSRKSSFSSYVQHKNRKNKQLIHLACVSFFHQPPTSNWHKISWINCLFFCFHVVRSLKKRTSSKICMFCPVSSN